MARVSTNKSHSHSHSHSGSKIHSHSHDHSAEMKRIARIKGQVEAVERMLAEGRYCPEIIQQVKSVRSALKGLEIALLEGHLKGCVKQAFAAKDPFESDEKMKELIALMKSQS